MVLCALCTGPPLVSVRRFLESGMPSFEEATKAVIVLTLIGGVLIGNLHIFLKIPVEKSPSAEAYIALAFVVDMSLIVVAIGALATYVIH